MTRWALCSVEIGPPAVSAATALESPSPRRLPYATAHRAVHVASSALAADDSAALRHVLAARVRIQTPVRAAVCALDDALDELRAWRMTWSSCQVLIAEMLMSGPHLAATGFVVGLSRDGTPSCIDVHLEWVACD
jgi:hypothetical protein